MYNPDTNISVFIEMSRCKATFEIDGVPEIVCPSVAERLSDLWMLLVWPFFVVACGLFTGYLAAKVSKTPSVQVRIV